MFVNITKVHVQEQVSFWTNSRVDDKAFDCYCEFPLNFHFMIAKHEMCVDLPY